MAIGSKSVKLPGHLWRALDEMSRDGAQHTDALVAQAVEHFVTLQGFAVGARPQRVQPTAAPPAPAPAPPTSGPVPDEDERLEYARTAARPVLATGPVEEPPQSKRPTPPPGPATTGLVPTHVPTKSKPAPAITVEQPLVTVKAKPLPAAEKKAEPVLTDLAPAHTPAKPVEARAKPVEAPAKPVEAPSKPVPPAAPAGPPAWLKRAALSDADPDRVHAKERIEQLEAEVAKLTVERPTTTPLSEADE